MKRAVMLLSLALCIGCGSTQKTPTAQTPFQGSWEFALAMPNSATDLIEANLTQTGSQISSTQAVDATYDMNGVVPCGVVFNQGCLTALTGTATGSSLSFTGVLVNCAQGNQCNLNGQGTLNGSTISGTWQAVGLNTDFTTNSGTFTATLVSPTLSGTYGGTVTTCVGPTASGCTSNGSDAVSATVSQGNNHSLTLTATLSGTDNGVFTFNGFALGNAVLASGTVSGHSVSLFGYYDQTGARNGVAHSIRAFDLNVNANGVRNGIYMGLLQ